MIAPTIAHSAATLELGPAVPKATATTPGVEEASLALWTDPTGRTEVGVWECTPGTFTARREGYTEVCQILTGIVHIDTTGGDSVTLTPGDTITMPSGWEGVWRVEETVRKVYITIND